MVTREDRISRLEGKIDSLATKEDVASLRADVVSQLSKHQAETAEQISKLRSETTEQIGILRSETTEQIAKLQTEMIDQVWKLRAEMIDQIGKLQAQAQKVEIRMLKWTMATVLAGMALAVTVGIAF